MQHMADLFIAMNVDLTPNSRTVTFTCATKNKPKKKPNTIAYAGICFLSPSILHTLSPV